MSVVWTEEGGVEYGWCLFGHGSKPDGEVWVMVAPGGIAHACGTVRKCGLTGLGAHATLASECRVLPQQQLLQRVDRGNGAHSHTAADRQARITGR